jgi:molybdopterin-guanine dinucleotide biosynthesis protein A
MGRDKSRLEYDGRTQLERGFELLGSVCEETFLSIRGDQPAPHGVPVLSDNYPNTGPLGGIVTAFDYFPRAAWLVIACDLPFLERETLADLVTERRRVDRAVYAYSSAHDGLPEPLCAIYEPIFAETLRRSLAEQHYCPRRILIDEAVPLLELPETAQDSLDNINTPEEFAEARTRLAAR